MFTLAAFSASGAAVSLLTAHNPSLRFCLGGVLVLSCHVLTLGVLFPLQVWLEGRCCAAEEKRLSPLLLLSVRVSAAAE